MQDVILLLDLIIFSSVLIQAGDCTLTGNDNIVMGRESGLCLTRDCVIFYLV